MSATPIRCIVRPSLRALWSSAAAALPACRHGPFPPLPTAHRLLPQPLTHSPATPARPISTSRHPLATRSSAPAPAPASASGAASTGPAAQPAEPADPAASIERSIAAKLRVALQPAYLQLEDTSGGCGTFFRLQIASPLFDGASLVRQHRLVKDAIKDDIGAIHGLTIDTMTLAQYAERKKAADERRKAPLI